MSFCSIWQPSLALDHQPRSPRCPVLTDQQVAVTLLLLLLLVKSQRRETGLRKKRSYGLKEGSWFSSSSNSAIVSVQIERAVIINRYSETTLQGKWENKHPNMSRQRESLKLTPFMCDVQRGTPAANRGFYSKTAANNPFWKNKVTFVLLLWEKQMLLWCRHEIWHSWFDFWIRLLLINHFFLLFCLVKHPSLWVWERKCCCETSIRKRSSQSV